MVCFLLICSAILPNYSIPSSVLSQNQLGSMTFPQPVENCTFKRQGPYEANKHTTFADLLCPPSSLLLENSSCPSLPPFTLRPPTFSLPSPYHIPHLTTWWSTELSLLNDCHYFVGFIFFYFIFPKWVNVTWHNHQNWNKDSRNVQPEMKMNRTCSNLLLNQPHSP